jgi:hypothetical protein
LLITHCLSSTTPPPLGRVRAKADRGKENEKKDRKSRERRERENVEKYKE